MRTPRLTHHLPTPAGRTRGKGVLVAFLLATLCLCPGVWAQEATDSIAMPDTLRVLAIGNSFSHDAVEQYLWELAHEVGRPMIIGNAYRGGQGFESHWTDVSEEHNTFEYRKVVEGLRTNTPHTALSTIITDEPWDFITFQQVSQESGLTSTFEPYLSLLIHYTDSLKTNPEARMGYHMTWAYSHDSTHGGFANYGGRQDVMYDSIVAAVAWAMDNHPELTFLAPSGTAIQNARTTYLGDNMNRDGYHLDYTFGRYTAACVWLETLTGVNPVGLTFRPAGVDLLATRTCQQAAHAACLCPMAVTPMPDEGFPAVNDITPAALIKLNFGATPSTDSAWNNITPDTRTYTWITDAHLNPTGIILTTTTPFCGTNTNGAPYTTTRMLMPEDVSTSCVWGYTSGSFAGKTPRPMGSYTLQHMNPRLEYDFSIFSSRDNCQDLRETSFVLQGEEVYAGQVEAAGNASEVVHIRHVRPTPDGRLTIMAMPGLRNSTAGKFYYLNAITIKAHK